MLIRGSLLVVYLFFTSFLYASEVKAFVITDNVLKGDSVHFHIKAEGNDIEFPLIDTIAGVEAKKTLSQKNTHLMIINGVSSLVNEETLIVSFVPDKNTTIESFEVIIDNKKFTTQPIDIVVSELSNAGDNQDISFELKLQKDTLYEQEPLIASLIFRYNRNIRIVDTIYTKPKFDGFLSYDIGNQPRTYQGDDILIQVDYLLVPMQSGTLTIDEAKAKIAIENNYSMGDRLGIFFDQPIWTDISSKEHNVTIKPLGFDVELVGDFTIEASVDKNITKANEPVVLTLKLSGNGVVDSIDASSYNIKDATLYKHPPLINKGLKEDIFEFTYSQKFIFVSDKDFTIPSLSLEAFSPSKETRYVLTTPSYDIEVEGSLVASYQEEEKDNNPLPQSSYNWGVGLVFLAGIIGGAFLLWGSLKLLLRKKRKKYDSTLMGLYPHVGKDKEVEEIVRQMYSKQQGKKGIVIEKEKVKDIVAKYNHNIS